LPRACPNSSANRMCAASCRHLSGRDVVPRGGSRGDYRS
jgi:hypothetical protein